MKGDRHFITSMTMITWCLKHYHQGIRTEKGEFNRWIKATNALIRQIRNRLSSLLDWVKEVRAELAKPQSPDLVSLLNAYYAMRGAKSYSRSGKVANLKEFSETVSYLQSCELYTLDDLEARVSAHRENVDGLKKTLDGQTARMKEIRHLYDSSAAFQSLKPVYDGLQKIKFDKPRAKYKAEHADDLKTFYAARRKLTAELTVFFLNARTPEKCSSALTATPQEVKPAPGWHRTFPARSPSFALSRQEKTGTMFSVSKGTFPAANS